MKSFDFLLGKDIEFLPGVEDFDSYVESGMRATVTNINRYPESDLYELSLCYSKFEDHNISFETKRYHDTIYNRHITFRELNGYDSSEKYCISSWFDNFKLLEEKSGLEITLH